MYFPEVSENSRNHTPDRRWENNAWCQAYAGDGNDSLWDSGNNNIAGTDTDFLTEEIAQEWCCQRKTENSSGFHRRAVVLREFSKYLFSVGKSNYILPSDSTARPIRYTPYIFSDKELAAIFDASNRMEPHPKSPCRQIIVPVMLRLIYFCGLRPNEGREIQNKDVDLDNGILFIRKNKSHRERRIPMRDDITDMCKEYRKKISFFYPDSPYFFPSPEGIPYSAKWLTRQFLMLWNEVRPPKNTARVTAPTRQFSRLNHTAFALAVYASHWKLLPNMQDSLPAVDQTLPGRSLPPC